MAGKQVMLEGHRVWTSNKGTRNTGTAYEASITSKMGYIDYIIYPEIKTIVFNGSYIEKAYRGKGKYKVLVKRLLSKWPGYAFQCLAVNKLVYYTLTKRFGFKLNNNRPLYYWSFAGSDKKGEPCWRMFRSKRTKTGITYKK